jgi:hypothetical protein
MVHTADKLTAQELAHKSILSRAQLQAIEEDPSKMEVVARLMGAVNLDNLFRYMQRPDVPAAARLEFQKILNRMGKLEPEEKSRVAETGPQVVINITRAKDADHGITIEGQAVGE